MTTDNDLAKTMGFSSPEPKQDNSLMQVEQSQAVAEVQAKYVIAQRFPRNQMEAYSRIIESCKRPFLAEQALYAYPKGGNLITGPSIRLAEAIGQSWGHIDFGIREISQSNGVSVCEAYAIDLCTNTHATKIFHVPHVRDTKKGRTKLTDAREIYELVANQGSRRMRACILAVVPGDVTEAAVVQCKKTLESSDIPLADQIRKMVLAFDEYGIKVEHLEKRLGHKIDSTISTEIVTLKSIYKSIRDGMADRSQFFDIGLEQKTQEAAQVLDTIIENKAKKEKGGTHGDK